MHQVSSVVFRTDNETAERTFNESKALIDLVAKSVSFELNLNANLQTVVEGGFTIEDDLRV